MASGRLAAAPPSGIDPGITAISDPLPAGATARLGTARFRAAGQVYGVRLSPGGETLVSLDCGGNVRFWDVPTGRLIRQVESWASGFPVVWSHDGKKAVVLETDDQLHILDAVSYRDEKGPLGIHSPGKTLGTTALAFSHDDKFLLVGFSNGKIRAVRVENGNLDREFDAEGNSPSQFTFPEGGKKLAAVCSDGRLRFWDWQTGKFLGKSVAFLQFFPITALSAAGATLSANGNLLEFTPAGKTGAQEMEIEAHKRSIAGVAISADEKVLASADCDGVLRLWKADNMSQLVEMRCDAQNEMMLALSADGSRVAACSAEGGNRIRVWNVARTREGKAQATELHPDSGPTHGVKQVEFLPSGRGLFSIDSRVPPDGTYLGRAQREVLGFDHAVQRGGRLAQWAANCCRRLQYPQWDSRERRTDCLPSPQRVRDLCLRYSQTRQTGSAIFAFGLRTARLLAHVRRDCLLEWPR